MMSWLRQQRFDFLQGLSGYLLRWSIRVWDYDRYNFDAYKGMVDSHIHWQTREK